jgi:hypothetical protein
MLSLTIEQLDAIIEYVASQLATIERIQSVSTMAITPTTNKNKG